MQGAEDQIQTGCEIRSTYFLNWTSFSLVRQPLVGLGLLIVEVLRSHSGIPHSAGLLWTSDRPVEGTST